MVQPKIQQKFSPADPDLDDVKTIWKKEVFLSLNCVHVGTVQSFDKVKQTAVVSINYLQSYYQRNDAGTYDTVTEEYPLSIDTPVVVLGGATHALTMPVAKGDECLLIFNDRDISSWFAGSSGSAVPTGRLHSFADGFALVGVRRLAKALTNYDGDRVVLRNGENARVAVGTDHVQVEYGPAGGTLVTARIDSSGVVLTKGTTTATWNASKAEIAFGNTKVSLGAKVTVANTAQNLNTNLQALVTQLQNLSTQLTNLTTAVAAITVSGVTSGAAASGPPVNAVAITAIGTTIGTINTAIGTVGTNLGSLLA